MQLLWSSKELLPTSTQLRHSAYAAHQLLYYLLGLNLHRRLCNVVVSALAPALDSHAINCAKSRFWPVQITLHDKGEGPSFPVVYGV